ncbi:MAG: vWA domain-containing protein, partial [Myxococcota bacterium]
MAMVWTGALLGVLLVGCGTTPAAAQGGTRGQVRSGGGEGGDAWVGGSPMRTRVVVGDDGETYVGVWIDAPDDVPAVEERASMALSLVVDTSGSMSGDKIAHARTAAARVLENLEDGDVVSVYGFSDGVAEIAPPTVVSPSSRGELVARVSDLRARGGTNLYGGLKAGITRLGQASGSHPIRRVMLISDGHANKGPSDPASLGDLAARGTEHGTQVSAIGVGLGYDEHTLGALAVRSAGRLYHLSHSAGMASILEQELELLTHTVATDAHVEIAPAPGVRFLDCATPGARMRGGKVRVKLGSVHAGQEREVLLRAELDTTRPGRHPVGTARLSFEPSRGGDAPVVQEKRLAYEVTRDRRAASKSEAPRVAAMVASHGAARAQHRAAELLSSGDGQSAARELAGAER